MEYSKEEKIEFVSKKWKAFYDVLPSEEKKRRLEFLKKSDKDDVNTLAKIKALENLI